jgi:nucleoid-associated protein YgaU
MTRDAKIGLLLGLVFIFIIAFIINGLPSLGRSDGNELTRNMARPQRNKPGIGTDARRVTQRTITPVRPTSSPDAPAPAATGPQTTEAPASQIRFEAQLPQPTPASQSTETNLAAAQTGSPQSALIATEQKKEPIAGRSKSQLTRAHIYTVQDGDSLASIAKHFYGEELGNKKANVERIFKANRKILKSADQIYVGQKLIVPALTQIAPDKPENVLPAEGFKPVESIGARHEQKAIKITDKTRYYTVKEGDSLWKIASEQLGDGNRYPELARLNKLEDEDFLAVGARLKLP